MQKKLCIMVHDLIDFISVYIYFYCFSHFSGEMKGSAYQQLIDKDKTANENSRSTFPPTPPPKPRNNNKKGM